MAQFISDKSKAYASELPATTFYPALKIAEFQTLFHFLEDETEAAILHNATIERITIHRELKPITGVIVIRSKKDLLAPLPRRISRYQAECLMINQNSATQTEQFEDLKAFSLARFDDETTAAILYKQAVFCKTAHALIGNRLATDATEEAAERDESLQLRADKLLANYRNAIDQLLQSDSGYTFEMI